MSPIPNAGHFRRDAEYTRFAILAREKGVPRKVAWITAGPGGIFLGVARAAGWGTKYNYRADGGFYRSVQSQAPTGPREAQELVTRYPPLAEIKGLLQVLPVDLGAGDRLRGLPFKRRYESISVKTLNGRVSFKVGLLEPGVPQALDTIKRKDERHFRLITKTEPWILLWNSAGFETTSH
jgi:hypothetical protein